jgi:phosphodiesterase/alkaline phosphatase D-like protein
MVDAHANAVATQQAVAKAGDPAQLMGTETQWMQRNVEQAASYWRILFETGLETNANLLKCLLAQQKAMGGPGPGVDIDTSKGAMLEMVENAYTQWLEASRSLITAPGAAQAPQSGGSRK